MLGRDAGPDDPAKGPTAAVPTGAATAVDESHAAVVDGIGPFHSDAPSGRPLAAAAVIAAVGLHRAEDPPGGRATEAYRDDAAHPRRGVPGVAGVRPLGPTAAVEARPRLGRPTKRAMRAVRHRFEAGAPTRTTSDAVAPGPPPVLERPHTARGPEGSGEAIQAEAARTGLRDTPDITGS